MGKRVVLGLASDLNCIRHPRSLRRNLITWVALKLSSQVIAQTRDQERLLGQNFGVDSLVFRNVIRRQAFSSARTVPFDKRDIDVLWVGTIEPRKGLEQVIELAERLPQHRIAVVGGPPVGASQYCSRIMEQVVLYANVVAPGFVEPHRVPSWMARSKVLLHTSIPVLEGLTKEGFPNVFLEAWASGLPVVSLYVDCDGLLSSGGLGVKCDSMDEAAEVIERITRDERHWAFTRACADDFTHARDTANQAVQDELVAILAGSVN